MVEAMRLFLNRKSITAFTAMLVCLLLLAGISAPAWADTADEKLVIDEELREIIENYLKDNNIDSSNVSIGYYYSGTGEEWFYNENLWLYSASVYKVPMMMQIAEMVNNGELTQDTDISGKTVTEIEELVLQWSNNDWAHTIREYLGGDTKWRTEAMKYARMEESEYDSDYVLYSYVNSKFVTQVFETLYNEPERFPMITDYLLQAMPEHYLRPGVLEYGTYPVAQKYGSYDAEEFEIYNHAAGIVYTKHPFVLTVMTFNVTRYEPLIAGIASIMTAYSLSLDAQLEAMTPPSPEPTAEPTPVPTPEPTAEPEPTEAPAEQQETTRGSDEQMQQTASKGPVGLLIAALSAAAVILIIVAVVIAKQRAAARERARRAARRRARKEQQRLLEQEQNGEEL